MMLIFKGQRGKLVVLARATLVPSTERTLRRRFAAQGHKKPLVFSGTSRWAETSRKLSDLVLLLAFRGKNAEKTHYCERPS